MRAGVSTACFYPLELEKAFRSLAENGVGNTEIFVNTDSELRDPYLSEMLSIQKEYGMRVASVHPYTCALEPMMLFSGYERRVGDMIDYYKRFWEYMHRFGAEFFVLHGNKLPHNCEDERYFERFLRLREEGEKCGVRVVQENVAYCSSGSIDFMLRMIKALGEKAEFVLDTKQAHRGNEDPIEVVKALGKNIAHVHFSDFGKQGDCLKFGFGEYDNEGLFRELKNCGYDGNVIIELYSGSYASAEDLANNYRALEEFIKQFD